MVCKTTCAGSIPASRSNRRCSSMEERLTHTQKDAGSIPGHRREGVAQLEERFHIMEKVVGSNPVPLTISID